MNTYLPLKKLAELAGVSYRQIAKVRAAGKWLGCELDIREVPTQGGSGGVGYEISIDSLPDSVRSKVAEALGLSRPCQSIIKKSIKNSLKPVKSTFKTPNYSRESLWAAWEVATNAKRARAEERLIIIKKIEDLVAEGVSKADAITEVAGHKGFVTIYRWYWQIKGIEIADWLPALLPQNYGRLAETESYHPAIYEAYKAYWLTPLKRSHSHCYKLVKVDAAREKWGEMPSLYMLKSRLEKEINLQVQDYMRNGEKAKSFQNPVPPLKRDKSGLVAMELVNGDGYRHKFNVIFADGTERKPVTWFWQDIYSGMILGYYSDVSENSDMLRFALRETIKQYGLGVNGTPFEIVVDNTRAASARALTGRATNRHRYALRPDEPIGIFGRLGCKYHPTMPYRGQSKPIERKFGIGGVSELVDKDPLVETARNAGKGISWEQFQGLLRKAVDMLNNNVSKSTVCGGIRTPREVFEASLSQNVVLKATAAQLNMLMMCAIGVPAHRENGSVTLLNNTYWNESLRNYCGEKVMIEYDPQQLHDGVNVYTLQGLYITTAPCIQPAGFNDSRAGREQTRLQAAQRKLIKKEAALAVSITALERAKNNIQQTPVGLVDMETGEILDYEENRMPEQRVVGLNFIKKPQQGAGLSPEQEAAYAENMARQYEKLRNAI